MATILMVVLTAAVPAQSPDDRKRAEAVERSSMRLLDELVAETGTIAHPEGRLALMAQAIELYWDRDEAKARNLIGEVTSQIIAINAENSREDLTVRPRKYNNRFQPAAIRSRVLSFLSRKDSRQALQFLQATRQPAKNNIGTGLVPVDEDRQLELELAANIARQDPDTAFRIAEEALDKELDNQVIEIFNSLIKDSPAHAIRLGGLMISELQSRSIADSYQALNFTFSMLDRLQAQIGDPAKKDKKPKTGLREQDLDSLRQLMRETLEIVVRNTLRISPADFMDNSKSDKVRTFMLRLDDWHAAIDKYLPNRSAAFKAKINQFRAATGKTSTAGLMDEYIKSLGDRSAKEFIEIAASAPEETRPVLYQKAMEKAMDEGDTETAGMIAREKMGNQSNGLEVLDSIQRRAAEQAVKRKKYDDAVRLLPPGMPDDEKAQFIARWAAEAFSGGDKAAAKSMVDQAKALVGEKSESRKQLDTRVLIALATVDVDPDSGFSTADAAIERINRVVASALDFAQFEAMNQGEFALEFLQFTEPLNKNLVTLLARLAVTDFQRTENLLRRWQAPEIRIASGLAVLKTILIGPEVDDPEQVSEKW